MKGTTQSNQSKTDTTVIEISLSKVTAKGEDNPRTETKNGSDIQELTSSIKQHGVLQPILVRSVNGNYELIAGARRLQATKLAGLASIPAKVIEADDRTAAALRLVENLQRKDLNAIEEADGFSRLIKDHGYSAEEVAESSAKSLQYVRQRIKLTDLPKSAKEALRSGSISPAIGLLIARIPDQKLREKATKEILRAEQDWYGGPMNYKQASEHLQRSFMTDLKDAPFKTDDESLVPAAGSCLTCPKRSGNQTDLFADVAKDHCTDNACYNKKKKAHFDRLLAKAKERGATVLEGKEAQGIQYGGKYIQLNDRCWDDPKQRTYRQLLGKDTPERVVAKVHEGVQEFVSKKEALDVLKNKGHAWAEERAKNVEHPKDDIKRKEKLELRQSAAQIAIDKIVSAAEKSDFKEPVWRAILEQFFNWADNEPIDILRRRNLELPEKEWDASDYLIKAAKDMKVPQLRGLLVEMVAQNGVPQSTYDLEYHDELKCMAEVYKVDLKAIEKQLAKEKPAKKAGKK